MTRSRDIADQQKNLGGAVAPFVAGKNKIINGDFSVWQRGTSFSPVANTEIFSADRWKYNSDGSGGSLTLSQQAFTAGTAPVAGYEGTYFWRYTCTTARTGMTYNVFFTNLEDVRTFAGQTVTLSFWAKASSNVALFAPYIQQFFGTGGSAGTAVVASSAPSLTTSWQRFSYTMVMPSIAGKTITSGSWIRPIIDLGTNTNTTGMTIDIWGVQLEAGSVATSFTPAGGGSQQAELALCQRYYWRSTGPNAYSSYGNGFFTGTVGGYVDLVFPVTMRVSPTSLDFANLAVQDGALTITAVTNVVLDQQSAREASVAFAIASGGVQHRPMRLVNNNNAAGYIGFSAEL